MAATEACRLMKLFSSQFAIPILLVLFAVSVGAQQPAKIRFEMSDAALARIREDFKIKLDQSLTKAKIAGATVAFVLADGRHAEFAAGVKAGVALNPSPSAFNKPRSTNAVMSRANTRRIGSAMRSESAVNGFLMAGLTPISRRPRAICAAARLSSAVIVASKVALPRTAIT